MGINPFSWTATLKNPLSWFGRMKNAVPYTTTEGKIAGVVGRTFAGLTGWSLTAGAAIAATVAACMIIFGRGKRKQSAEERDAIEVGTVRTLIDARKQGLNDALNEDINPDARTDNVRRLGLRDAEARLPAEQHVR